MYGDIGYFPQLRVDGKALALERREKGQNSEGIVPNTRNYLYIGNLRGQEIVVKPYEAPLEKTVTQLLKGSPISLILDSNDRYFVEQVAKVDTLEDQNKFGRLSAASLGEAVGTFLAQIHLKGLGYNNDLNKHLFRFNDGSVKATDFGATGFHVDERIHDIVEGFEFLGSTIKDPRDLRTAIDAFRATYVILADQRLYSAGIKRHLKFAENNDPTRELIKH